MTDSLRAPIKHKARVVSPLPDLCAFIPIRPVTTYHSGGYVAADICALVRTASQSLRAMRASKRRQEQSLIQPEKAAMTFSEAEDVTEADTVLSTALDAVRPVQSVQSAQLVHSAHSAHSAHFEFELLAELEAAMRLVVPSCLRGVAIQLPAVSVS